MCRPGRDTEDWEGRGPDASARAGREIANDAIDEGADVARAAGGDATAAAKLVARRARYGLQAASAAAEGDLGRAAHRALLAVLGPAAFVVVGFLAVIAVFLTVVLDAPACPQTQATALASVPISASGKREIPKKFMSVYVDAAARYRLGPEGWSYLASIHRHENGFADSGGSPTSTSGALGPMQFMPSTWAAYGVDGDRDGRKDVQNVIDALFGAASYLRASGAPKDWDRAIFAYNHAGWYVAMIKETAASYRGDGAATTVAVAASGRGGCTCGQAGDERDGGGADLQDASLPAEAPTITWPTRQRSIISPFGMRWGRLHAGVDIPMPTGTPLHAIADGEVVLASSNFDAGGYGNYTCIQHAARLSSCYAHQSKIKVRQGQPVKGGAVIGYSGCTGHCLGPHLHFEIRLGKGFAGRPADPAPYLEGASGPAGGGELTSVVASGGCAAQTENAAAFSGGTLGWPTAKVRGELIGFPYQGTHTLGNWQSDNAIDIRVPVGTPIVAVADGEICPRCGFGALSSANPRFAGLRLTLNTATNQVYYAHLSRFATGIRPGARVRRGQVIGYSGSANGVAHLHIGFKLGDPRKLLGTGAPSGVRA